MNAASVKTGIRKISRIMAENKDYLIKLDQQNGDGDLGVSMSEGFEAAAVFVEGTQETDLGKILMQTGGVFNEAAPSSLGTIISFAFMGMAKSLKGRTEAGLPEFAEAVMAGVQKIMDKAMEAADSTDASSAVKVEKTSISMVCSQFNAVKEITIPEEAKSAESISANQ